MKLEVKAFIKKEVLRLKAKEHLTSRDVIEIDSIKKLVEYENIQKMRYKQMQYENTNSIRN